MRAVTVKVLVPALTVSRFLGATPVEMPSSVITSSPLRPRVDAAGSGCGVVDPPADSGEALGSGHSPDLVRRRKAVGHIRTIAAPCHAHGVHPRAAVLADVAARVAALPNDAPRLVGIDGVDGVGKTVFADELAHVLRGHGIRVVQVSIDGFHRPRIERYRRGRASAEGYFRDSFDIDALLEVVIAPLRPGGSGTVRTAVFDYRMDSPVPGELVPVAAGDVILLDGVFLHQDALADVWDLSVLLRAPLAVAIARMAERDGMPMDDRIMQRYREGQRMYLAECSPEQRASLVIDHTDVTAPRVVDVEIAGG